MTPDTFGKFVAVHEWRYAKTMPKNPHFYIVKNAQSPDQFHEAVNFIRENGYVKYFFKRRFVYYDYDGYSYWTMGDPIEETIILNRAIIEGTQ